MTSALWCVFIAGVLPYLATPVAKFGADFDNANPRAWLAKQDGFRSRANAAQLNGFETFPLFAAAVIIAHVRNAPSEAVNALAFGFVACRVIYLGMYLANLDKLRSLVWFAGFGCSAALFLV